MTYRQKFLILKSGHQMTAEDIKDCIGAYSISDKPNEHYSLDEKTVIFESVSKIMAFKSNDYGASVYFVDGANANTSYFRLQSTPCFAGAYKMSYKQFEECLGAASAISSFQDVRGYISDAYNFHHWNFSFYENDKFNKMKEKYSNRIEFLYENYGLKEIEKCTTLIEINLCSIW